MRFPLIKKTPLSVRKPQTNFIYLSMKQFASITEAFEWWMKNIYPSLPPERKKGHLKSAWRDHTYKLGISEKRMQAVLLEFGKVEVKTLVTFTPD